MGTEQRRLSFKSWKNLDFSREKKSIFTKIFVFFDFLLRETKSLKTEFYREKFYSFFKEGTEDIFFIFFKESSVIFVHIHSHEISPTFDEFLAVDKNVDKG